MTRGTSSACSNPNFSAPLYAYWHGSNRGGGLSAAITGGTFYRGNQFPAEYYGAYFFADDVDNFIDVLMPDGELRNMVSATAGPGPVDLDVGPDGALYYLSYAWASMGGVYRISALSGSNHQPHADFTAYPAAGPAPLAVNFNGSASSDPDNNILVFHWDFGDGSTQQGVELRQVSHTFSSDGQYLVTLEVQDGGGLQHSATLMIVAGNGPVGVITAPAPNMSYNAGDSIHYSGSASDAEDGDLPASAFAWTVVLHHDDHTHPSLGPIYGVRQGNFTIPVNGETDTDVFYRIHLSVTDSSGIEDESYVDIFPRTVSLTLAANIAGAALQLEGVSYMAPWTFGSVVGMARTISAPATQTINGQTYRFVSWSDGGSQTHQIFTPPSNTTYAATYELSP